MLKSIKNFINDKDKKPLPTIIKEVLGLYVSNKSFPKHYFSRGFYHKNLSYDYKNFLDLETYTKIVLSENFKSPALESTLYNKLSFGHFCEENDIPTPKILSHNFYKNFAFNNKNFEVSNHQELKNYFNTVFDHKKIDELFLKPIHGHQGMGMYIVNRNTSDEEYKTVFKDLIKNPYLHQEIITQHDEINKISNKTINTLRMETYVDDEFNIHFLGFFIRFGIGDSIVDNVSAGGIFVPINIDSGIIFDYGYKSKYGLFEKCFEHPDSKVSFKDFQIPFFEEAKKTVIDATRKLPKKLIGWDVAITPNGPVILEGNYIPGILFGEFTYNGYKNLPIFEKIIAEATA